MEVIWYILWISFGVQVIFLSLMIYTRFIPRKSKASRPDVLPKVSIIIAIRNNASGIARQIQQLSDQEYPDFEIVLVNDGSNKEESSDLERICAPYERVRLIRKDKSPDDLGKRAALHLGIESSSGTYILFTDADCMPISKYWISTMVQTISNPNISIVLGFSPYLKLPGLLNQWIQFETLFAAGNMLAFTKLGRPYMGIGRNMLVRKKLFSDTDVYDKAPIISGDDDLTINQFSHAKNTAICTQADALVVSSPVTTWQKYVHQKRRHLSAGKYYRLLDQVLLALQSFSHAVFLLSVTLILVFSVQHFAIALSLVLIRSTLLMIYYLPMANKLRIPMCWHQLLKWDALLPLYLLFFSPYIFWKDIQRWD